MGRGIQRPEKDIENTLNVLQEKLYKIGLSYRMLALFSLIINRQTQYY
jgi:hypothetical protein